MDQYLVRIARQLLLGVALSLGVVGCGGGANDALDALPSAIDVAQRQAEVGVTALNWSDADLQRLSVRGAALYKQCRVCHQIGAGAQHRSGPSLNQVVGRKAGSAAGFSYSTAMRSSDFVWDEAALDAWLARPWRFLPGTSMQYGGISDAEDRRAMIAYLVTASE
ncbi:MAG: cytochrome c family protein [Pseudomonadota bacterium]